MEDFKTTISEVALEKRRKLVYIMVGCLPVAMLLFFSIVLYGTGLFLYTLAGFAISTLLLVILARVIVKEMLAKLAKNEVLLTEEALIRQNEGHQESLRFEEIKMLKVLREYNGRVRVIELKIAKKWVIVHSFLEMDELLTRLLAKVDTTKVKLIDRKVILDYYNPFILIPYIFTVTGLIVAAKFYLKESYDNISLLFPIVFGLYLLLGGPMSNASGKRFRKFELILGPLLLVFGTFTIVMKLLS